MSLSKSRSIFFLFVMVCLFSQTAKAGSFTASGSTLNIDLNVANQLVTVVSTGTTYTFTLSGGATNTWTGTTSTSVSVSGAVLTVTATGLTTFSTINITDSQTGTAVTFATSGANSYADNINVTLDNSPGAVNFSGSSSFSGSNALNVTTSMNIAFASLSSLSTVNGNLTLDANTQATPNSMSYAGVYMDSSTVQITGTGVLSVTARGGGNTGIVAAQNTGISVVKGSKLIGGTTGTATILGRSYTGVAGAVSGIGVYISGGSSSDPAKISSNGADVSITGYGAVSTATAIANQCNYGVAIGSATQSASTLYGTITSGGSGAVTIVGYGGSAASPAATSVRSNCIGVSVSSTNVLVTTGGGNLTITGTGGGSDTLSDENHGVVVNGGSVYPGGTNANLEVTGTGGTVSGNGGYGNTGICLGLNGAGQVKGGLGTGTTLITGYGGGKYNSGYNNGVYLNSSSVISSLGTGTVTVKGYGGNKTGTGTINIGVKMTGTNAPTSPSITSNGGNVLVEGTGGGGRTSASNYGVNISINSYITAGGNGTVTVNGIGGNTNGVSGNGNYGVYLTSFGSGQGESYITSNSGNVNVTGTGGGGSSNSASGSSSNSNYGVFVDYGSYITAGGTGSVNVTGTGGNSSTNATGGTNYGIYVGAFSLKGSTGLYSTSIISGGGNIVINGTGGGNGTSATNHGVYVKGLVKAFGSGTVTVNGTGGSTTTGATNTGVTVDGAPTVNSVVYPATISSEGGAVTINGTGGGTGTSTSNHGTYVNGGGIITAGSTGAVNITGTGGGGLGTGQQNYGVYVNGGTSPNFSTITSGGGNVSVTGTGPQNTGGANQHGINVNGGVISSGANGNVTLTGTAGIGDVGTTGNGHIGVQVSGANGLVSSGGTGTVTVSGSGGGNGARANNYGIQVVSGAGISSGGAGDVTLNGVGGTGTTGGNYGLLVTGTNSRINTGGGNLTINTTEGSTANSLATSVASAGIISTATNGGNITIKGNSFNTVAGCTLAAPAAGTLKFIPLTSTNPIAFNSTTDTKGSLIFSSAELATMSGGTLIFGNTSTGPITLTTVVDLSTAPQSSLTLVTASSGGGLKPKVSGNDIKMTDGKTLSLSGASPLIINIAGTTVNTQYDQLNVSGTVDLTGLSLSLTGAYTPVSGNVFTIVSATSVTGTFSGLADGSTVTINGRTLVVNYTTTAVTLSDLSPAITTQPTSQTVNAGNQASFTAAASGTPTPTVQWQVSANSGSNWSDITGATAETYSFTAAAGDQSKQYKAIFTNTYGSATTSAVTLTVNIAPAITTHPSNATVVAGNTASFTAAASGTPTPTVQWQLSTNNGGSWNDITGATATSYTTGTLVYTDNGNRYRAVFSNSASSTNSDAAILTVNPISVTWNGSTSTDWNNSANWTPNFVPESTTETSIPSGLTTYPTLDQNRSMKDLTVANGVTLSLGSFTLSLTGLLINDGTIDGSGDLEMAGSSAQTISGNGHISNLKINNSNGVSIASGNNKLTLTNTLKPTSGTLTTNGNLELKSDGNRTARIAEGNGNYISGNVTVQRYIATNQRGWRLLSLPVTVNNLRDAWAGANANAAAPSGETAGSGTLITGHGYATGVAAAAAGFDWFSGLSASSTSSIRFYDGVNGHWNSATNTPSMTTTPDKQGYMLYIRGDRTVASSSGSGVTTLKPVGEVKKGTQTIAISNTYEPVGNPYPSPIDLDAVYGNSGNNAVIERNFWVWDATLGTSGGFRAISYGASSYAMTGGSGNVSDYLKVQSGQAFFVKKASAGTITIKESNKVGGSMPVVFGVTSPLVAVDGQLQLNLFRNNQQLDGTLVRFNDLYQSAATETYDMAKLNNFNENFSVVNGSNYLSIESRPYPTTKDTVKLAFWNLAQSTYTLNLNSSNLGGRIGYAVLVDKFTNTRTGVDLTGSTTAYNFAVTADAASSSLNRFTVIFSTQSSLPVNLVSIGATVTATGVSVNWKSAQEANVSRYELERSADGVVYTKIGVTTAINNSNGAGYSLLDASPVLGTNMYRIKAIDLDGRYQYSSVVKAYWNKIAGIELLPTVTTDGRVTLVLRNQPTGNYRVNLFGVNGARLYSKEISHEQTSGVYELQLSAGAAQLVQGVYYLEVRNGKQQDRFKVLKH